MSNLTQQQWTELLVGDKNAVILDVRSSEEYNNGKIPNSINVAVNPNGNKYSFGNRFPI